MNTMHRQPDWNKYSFFATVVVGALAFAAYLRPPDPAHPVTLDFLWTNVSLSLPLWLASITAGVVVLILFYAGRAYQRRVSPSTPTAATTPNMPPKPSTGRLAQAIESSSEAPLPPPPATDDTAALVLNSPDDITIKFVGYQYGSAKGIRISVINRRLTAVSRIKLTFYAAQSYDSRHNDYRDGKDFGGFAREYPDTVNAGFTSNPVWFIRKDRLEHLLLGEGDDHIIRWPETDKTTVQRWLITIGVTGVYQKSLDLFLSLNAAKARIVVIWDQATNEFRLELLKDGSNATAPDLDPNPPAPMSQAEMAVLEWVRRIHTQAKTGFQRRYPELVAIYPNGDKFGYVIVTTANEMEQALHQTAFHDYGDLCRLYIVMIPQHDRESTAILRTASTRLYPARTSIVVGTLDNNRVFGAVEEHPDQRTWRR